MLGLPLVVAALWAGRPGLQALAFLVGTGGAWELAALFRARGWQVPAWVTIIPVWAAMAGAWLTVAGDAVGSIAGSAAAAWILVVTAGFINGVAARKASPQSIVGLGGPAALSSVYLGWSMALWPELFNLAVTTSAASPWALATFPLVVTWLGDTGAYFGGRFWGRTPLAPELSPAKTVEGAVAGLLLSLVTAAAFVPWLPWPTTIVLTLGGVVGIVGQIGDLWESALKRVAGVKDSGQLIPGHGGFLDRFDAIFFAVPITYYAALVLL